MGSKMRPLIDVCEAITDGSHFSPQADPFGAYLMASVRDMNEYEFDFSSCKTIGEEDYRTMQRNGCCPKKGDILIGKDGANFYLDAFIYDQEERPAIRSSIAIIRPNKNLIVPEYLFAYLRSPAVVADVRANYKSGSAIPRIVLKDFKRLPIWMPDKETQRKIAETYTNLNRKIRINQRTNDYLAA